VPYRVKGHIGCHVHVFFALSDLDFSVENIFLWVGRPCHGGSAIIYQQLPTHYTTYKIIPITPQPIPPTISNEIPIKAYRKLGRKSYRKNSGIDV